MAGFVSQISGIITIKITADSQNMSFSPSIAACAFNDRSKNASAWLLFPPSVECSESTAPVNKGLLTLACSISCE